MDVERPDLNAAFGKGKYNLYAYAMHPAIHQVERDAVFDTVNDRMNEVLRFFHDPIIDYTRQLPDSEDQNDEDGDGEIGALSI